MTWYLKPWCLPGETMTDMYYPIYAEGLYKSLMQVHPPQCSTPGLLQAIWGCMCARTALCSRSCA